MTTQSIVFYAFGSGAGHLTRAASIARKIRAGFSGDIHILSNSPFCPLFEGKAFSVISVPTVHRDPLEVGEQIRTLLRELEPLILVVDTFPSGLGGELSGSLENGKYRRVLIKRLIRQDFRDQKGFDEFTAHYYDAVIFSELSPAPPVSPILIRDFEELPDREHARRRLSVGSARMLIIAAGSGDHSRQRNFFSLVRKVLRRAGARHCELRCASLLPLEGIDLPSFPLIDALPAADIAIGACGYNFFHESQSLSIPSLYLPVQQKYDDQGRRAGDRAVKSPEELQERIERLLEGRNFHEPTSYVNGAHHAAGIILALL